MAQRRSISRRLAAPILILVAAGVVWIVAKNYEGPRMEDVRLFVEELCVGAAEGKDMKWRVATSEDAVAGPLLHTLAVSLNGVDLDQVDWSVNVVPGDLSMYADGTATHTVTVELEGADVLGLRVEHRDMDDIVVLGTWYPGTDG